MDEALEAFDDRYAHSYQNLMWQKLGLTGEINDQGLKLLNATLELLDQTQIGYHQFFTLVTQRWANTWHEDFNLILGDTDWLVVEGNEPIKDLWQQLYQQSIGSLTSEQLALVGETLAKSNPATVPLRPLIEEVWESIVQEDNWQPFYDLVAKLQA
jgi:serine/tyrosine/threonine adenylyltransferase